MDDWKDKHYAFYCNLECECFPCHQTNDPEDFNCLFCWCPLYALGEKCGGNYRYTEDGIKDCSRCPFPHIRSNYGKVMERFNEVAKLAARKETP